MPLEFCASVLAEGIHVLGEQSGFLLLPGVRSARGRVREGVSSCQVAVVEVPPELLLLELGQSNGRRLPVAARDAVDLDAQCLNVVGDRVADSAGTANDVEICWTKPRPSSASAALV